MFSRRGANRGLNSILERTRETRRIGYSRNRPWTLFEAAAPVHREFPFRETKPRLEPVNWFSGFRYCRKIDTGVGHRILGFLILCIHSGGHKQWRFEKLTTFQSRKHVIEAEINPFRWNDVRREFCCPKTATFPQF